MGSLNPSEKRYEALLQLLRSADTLWNASRVFFAAWQLSPSQFNVLNLLRLHQQGLSQTDLSRRLIMHRSNVTGLVDRLESRGLLQRTEDQTDRRAYRVILTDKGNGVLEEILPRYHAQADRVWKTISAKRTSELLADLQRVAWNAQQIAEELSTPEGT